MGLAASGPKITARDRAILDMKTQRDKLHQYQKKIATLTDKETDIAKRLLLAGDRKRALLALRRKKYQESLLAKTDAQLEQLEKLTGEVEFALVQKDVLFGLQQGTKVLKEIHREMGGIDQVEKLMADNEEARAYQKEISEMLGGKISNHDEDEVEDELQQLEQEVNGATMNPDFRWMTSSLLMQITAEPVLPDVPTTVPAHAPDKVAQEDIQLDMDGEQERAKTSAKLALQASDPLPA
ncbi:MAG: Vacuolar protein sorting-associated protein 20 [Peltula sp. TS41687]|nr:MAG: Vacuolar protein sorting-associated protein 20 [Peltula sp. TS41687]